MVLLGSSFCFGLANPCLPAFWIFHPHSFSRHDHVFTQCYTDYFMANIAEMLTHVRAIGTRPLFSPPLCGLGTRLRLDMITYAQKVGMLPHINHYTNLSHDLKPRRQF